MNNPTYYSLNKDKCKAASIAWYYANKDKAAANGRSYYALNKDRLNAARKERAKKNPRKRDNAAEYARRKARNPNYIRTYKPTKEQNRKNQIKSKYNLSWPQFTALYEKQHGVCPICSAPLKIEFGLKKGELGWNIDHCHKTNKVRGILCRSCNRGLARFQDSKEIMLKAVSYLENPPFNGEE